MRHEILFLLLATVFPAIADAASLEQHEQQQQHLLRRSHRTRSLADYHYHYETKTFQVAVDHFSFSLKDTFKMRYLVNGTWEKGPNAPIFFYTGNEGDIETFAENTGFMWEIAPQFKALIVFAEHRYYGESLPYGNLSLADPRHAGYLTSRQALADYVSLIEYLRSSPDRRDSPVVVFGGSYGGMLSAWIRIKYPHIVQGAIAASAPILQFLDGNVSCQTFWHIVTDAFNATYPTCPKLIRSSWTTLRNITSNDEGKKWLTDEWKLCSPLKTAADVEKLIEYLIDVYTNLAMVNYPYESNFLAPLPANPVSVVCSHLTNSSLTGKPLLTALRGAINVYTNYTGKTSCVSSNSSTQGIDGDLWDYQACTEMVMPMCPDGVNDMFPPQPWNLEKYVGECANKYRVNPRPHLVCQEYGCSDLGTATNIVFSNGLMDPWSSGGVLRNLSPSARAVLIPEGAHHLDLRASNANDPPSVILARNIHRDSIRTWIEEHRRKTGNGSE